MPLRVIPGQCLCTDGGLQAGVVCLKKIAVLLQGVGLAHELLHKAIPVGINEVRLGHTAGKLNGPCIQNNCVTRIISTPQQRDQLDDYVAGVW